MEKKKILLVGPYPPPFGGISVQISRIQKALLRMDYECKVLNIGESREREIDGAIAVRSSVEYLSLLFSFARRGYLIHIITSGHNFKSWLSALACSLTGYMFGVKSVVALGSGQLPMYMESAGFFLKLLIIITLRRAGKIICRNDDSRAAIHATGASMGDIAIVPGFLGVEASDVGQLPDDVQQFMEKHDPVIGAHAIIDPEYGLSFLLDAFTTLVEEFPRIGIILIGLEQDDAKQFQQFQKLQDHILPTGFLQHPDALAVLKSLKVFIRATSFDGDSNSVREALCLGVPVVASNTDFRPSGVHLFTIGDRHDFIRQVSTILKKRTGAAPAGPAQGNPADNLQKILLLYDTLLK